MNTVKDPEIVKKVNFFGVRHLSPGASYHLLQVLNSIKPDLVLIEGFADADSLIPYIVNKGSRAPLAILAYTDKAPFRTMVYPLAEYSPEYQAMLWSSENRVSCHFIDLPSSVFMGLSQQPSFSGEEDNLIDIHTELTNRAGEEDYDSYWERNFEQNMAKGAFQTTALELGRTMRLLEEGDRNSFRAENLVREAYMRRRISEYITSGVAPEKIAVITGAYHTPALSDEISLMTDKEFKSLPKEETSLTLMPYSFYKLSNQSGYGAGNKAPSYFQRLWNSFKKQNEGNFSVEYLSELAALLRNDGRACSSAHVIEAVRLAETLSSLKGGVPVLQDLRDAAATVFTEGKKKPLERFFYQLEVGNKVGALPENSIKTSIQDDFYRQLKELNLERFKENYDQILNVDLRKNLKVKSKSAAFLGLRRSVFLHRLSFLGVPFAVLQDNSKGWEERWSLNWRPESEIALVECVLLGETIELAVSARFQKMINNCDSIIEASHLFKCSVNCGMTPEFRRIEGLLQKLAADSTDLPALADTAYEISGLIKFGSVRNIDLKDFVPLLREIFTEVSLQIVPFSNCDKDGAVTIRKAIDRLDSVAYDSPSLVDLELYLEQLRVLSMRDDLNAFLSGYATTVLLERKKMTESEMVAEVCRRISPGIPADLGTGWFEGLASRNKSILLNNKAIWQSLSHYIEALDDGQFKRALVFLRRTFADFAPSEIRSVASTIISILGRDESAVEKIEKIVLSEAEIEALKELDDLDL